MKILSCDPKDHATTMLFNWRSDVAVSGQNQSGMEHTGHSSQASTVSGDCFFQVTVFSRDGLHKMAFTVEEAVFLRHLFLRGPP